MAEESPVGYPIAESDWAILTDLFIRFEGAAHPLA
jgi:hypothetical protein